MAFPRFRSPYGAPQSFPGAHPRFVTPYGAGTGRVRRRLSGFRGLGAVTVPQPRVGACPAWGCNGPRTVNWNTAAPVAAPTSGTAAPSPSANAGTPVPGGYPTDQIFMAPDGSQWVYSTAQGVWMDVGTPYNLSVASPPPNASTSMPSTPTVGATYTDSSGNIWTFNGSQWNITGNTLSAALTSTASAAAAVPTSPTIGQTYTDASGNIYTWNGTAWGLTTAAGTSSGSDYTSILDFLTEDNLITGVPNWIVGAGLVAGYLLLSRKSGRR